MHFLSSNEVRFIGMIKKENVSSVVDKRINALLSTTLFYFLNLALRDKDHAASTFSRIFTSSFSFSHKKRARQLRLTNSILLHFRSGYHDFSDEFIGILRRPIINDVALKTIWANLIMMFLRPFF